MSWVLIKIYVAAKYILQMEALESVLKIFSLVNTVAMLGLVSSHDIRRKRNLVLEMCPVNDLYTGEQQFCNTIAGWSQKRSNIRKQLSPGARKYTNFYLRLLDSSSCVMTLRLVDTSSFDTWLQNWACRYGEDIILYVIWQHHCLIHEA